MNNLKVLINRSIKVATDEYKKVKQELKNETTYHKKQIAQARYFKIDQEEVGHLKINEEEVGGVHFNNMSYCLNKFIQQEAKDFEIFNHERASHYVPANYPITRQLEIEPDVFVEIWTEATIFFKWNNEPFCVSISSMKFRENVQEVTVATKNWECLRLFNKTFREYQKKNHYLREKKFIGIQGELMRVSHYAWDDILLDNGLTQRIKSELEGVIRCSKELSRYGLNSKKGFILAGDPGNGKTLLLKIIANTQKATCIIAPFNKSKAELDMRGIFSLARDLAPTILMLEDIDLYAEDRVSIRDAERLGELMNELDGMVDNKEIIVFATTNNLSRVEKALQSRPGRFDRIYKIANPDFEGRLRLLTHFINKVPHDMTEENIGTIAEEFEGYSGSYLKELVNSGFAQAILRDDKNHVLHYSDLAENTAVLKNKDEKKFIGFAVPSTSRVEVFNKAQESVDIPK